jgi:hypothetical protein
VQCKAAPAAQETPGSDDVLQHQLQVAPGRPRGMAGSLRSGESPAARRSKPQFNH